jgi:hypothetical protein
LGANAWIQTIADYSTWRVIKTSEVIPVIDILPPDIRNQIEALAPKASKAATPLTGKYVLLFLYSNSRKLMCPSFIRWVDAIEHVVNHKDEVDAKWLKLHRPETGAGEWFFLGQSLDKNKALMVKGNEPGALGKLTKSVKIWDNEGADTSGKCHVRRQPRSVDVFSNLFLIL